MKKANKTTNVKPLTFEESYKTVWKAIEEIQKEQEKNEKRWIIDDFNSIVKGKTLSIQLNN